MIKYLNLKHIELIHKKSIQKYGGTLGIRDKGLLESALARPLMSAFGEDAYPGLFLKAAVTFFSLIKNHPFLDGNKRTAFGAMHIMLLLNNYDLTCSSKDVEKMAFDVIAGKLNEQGISEWIKKYSEKRTKNY